MSYDYERYQEYIQSKKWKAIAALVKEMAGGRCQVCNSDKNLHCHHRTYEHLYNEEAHLGDLTCLCRDCHELFHSAKQKKKKRKPRRRKRIPRNKLKELPPSYLADKLDEK